MSGTKRDRDLASEAFRRWARAGRPETVQIRQDGSDTARDYAACAAVFDALKREETWGRENSPAREIRRAVEDVYMVDPERRIRKNVITMRVRRFASDRYVSERLVYIWLARARKMWWEFRG